MDDEREIDLTEIFKDIKRNLSKIVIFCVIAFLIGGLFGVIKNRGTKVTTTGSLLVLQKPAVTNNSSKSTLEELNGQYIEVETNSTLDVSKNQLSTANIISYINSDFVFEDVYNNLQITESQYDHHKVFEISKDASSDLINIVCTINNGELASKAINEIVKVFKEFAPNVMDVSSIDLVSGPNVTVNNNNNLKSFLKYGAIGFAIALVVVLGYSLGCLVLDNKVRTEDDIKSVIDLPIVSKFPSSSNINDSSYKYGIKEIRNFILEEIKSGVVNIITISDESLLIKEIFKDISNSKKKIKIIDINKEKEIYKDGIINSSKLKKIINQEKKNNDIVFIIESTTKESHDYAIVSKYSDSNILIIKKLKDKFNDLSEIVNNSNIYSFNIKGIIFENVD